MLQKRGLREAFVINSNDDFLIYKADTTVKDSCLLF